MNAHRPGWTARPLRRRSVLLAGATIGGFLVTGCSVDSPEVPPPAPPDVLDAVLDEHLALLRQYDVAASTFPDLAPRLAPLRANIAEHVDALAGALAIEPPSTEPTGSASAGSSASESSTAPPPPPDPAAALSGLSAAEAHAGANLTALIPGTTARRAPLLGSIAAAHACHEVLLA